MILRQANIGDHILCGRLGDEEFRVVGEDSLHYTVESTKTGMRSEVYKALCSTSVKLAFANRDRRADRANEIGKPKLKPGKKK